MRRLDMRIHPAGICAHVTIFLMIHVARLRYGHFRQTSEKKLCITHAFFNLKLFIILIIKIVCSFNFLINF